MPFRLDRFLTLHLFGPLARRFPPKKGIRIPILMYHSICDEPETGHPYFWINTSPARFAEHMQFLHDNGYQVISLSQAVELIKRESEIRNQESSDKSLEPCALNLAPGPLTRHPVVLTFDDGYQDFYTHAFPILKQYDFPSTVYLPTAFIGKSSGGLKGKRHLGWSEVRDLQDEGIEFGSHTVNHPQLYDLKPETVESEIGTSKREIENRAGREVVSFSYPYKFPEQDEIFKRMFESALSTVGYRNGITTRIGTAHRGSEVFSMKRIPINSADDIPFFRRKLEGDYDWLAGIQHYSKKIRNFPSEKASIP